MRRSAFASAALVCCLAFAPAAFAQAGKAPAASSTKSAKNDVAPAVAAAPSPEVLKARMRPPVKGTAYIEIIPGAPKPVKGELISAVKVKNVSNAPIVGLKVDQYFYASQKEVSACTYRVRFPLAPNEITDVTLECPLKPGINGSQMMFSQANGGVKPTSVKKFTDDAKAPGKK